MAKGKVLLTTNMKNAPKLQALISLLLEGSISADRTQEFGAPFEGIFDDIEDIIFGLGTTGVGGTRYDFDVRIGTNASANSIFSTLPSLQDGADDGANTFKDAADDEVEQGVLKDDAAARTFAKGQRIFIVFDEIGNFTTNPTDASIMLSLTRLQDYDPDMTEERP